MDTPLHQLTLTEVARRLASGDLTSRAVTEHALDRCVAMADSNAIITLMPDVALAAADRADSALRDGTVIGPLHGVPLTIKDIFDIEGLPTTAGMPSRLSHRATRTATVVARVVAAGGVVLGKANVAEGVYGSYLAPFGDPVNPWNADYWGGASSGGSGVAVASDLGYGSIGSDTGGSIRMPSAVNGVTGLKPTWGRVSRDAVFELSGTLDHMGPMARTAEDAALLFRVIAGRDDRDPTSLNPTVEDPLAGLGDGIAGMVIGRPVSWLADGVDPEVTDALEATLAILGELGARIVDVTLPDDTDIVATWHTVSTAQIAVVHESHFPAHVETYSPALAAAVRQGRDMAATTLQKAQNRRLDFMGRLKRSFDSVDAFLLPVLPFLAPTRAAMAAMDQDTIFALHRYVCPFTLTGVPSLAFPAGIDRNAMPIGLQLVGPDLAEARLLRTVYAFQQVTGFHAMRATGA